MPACCVSALVVGVDGGKGGWTDLAPSPSLTDPTNHPPSHRSSTSTSSRTRPPAAAALRPPRAVPASWTGTASKYVCAQFLLLHSQHLTTHADDFPTFPYLLEQAFIRLHQGEIDAQLERSTSCTLKTGFRYFYRFLDTLPRRADSIVEADDGLLGGLGGGLPGVGGNGHYARQGHRFRPRAGTTEVCVCWLVCWWVGVGWL